MELNCPTPFSKDTEETKAALEQMQSHVQSHAEALRKQQVSLSAMLRGLHRDEIRLREAQRKIDGEEWWRNSGRTGWQQMQQRFLNDDLILSPNRPLPLPNNAKSRDNNNDADEYFEDNGEEEDEDNDGSLSGTAFLHFEYGRRPLGVPAASSATFASTSASMLRKNKKRKLALEAMPSASSSSLILRPENSSSSANQSYRFDAIGQSSSSSSLSSSSLLLPTISDVRRGHNSYSESDFEDEEEEVEDWRSDLDEIADIWLGGGVNEYIANDKQEQNIRGRVMPSGF
ncbi:hypothetical protein HK100_010408 [Physocladia obscura]|uniref:Uncharacterized protein n=1 Tax=Physocladia obscura TaxID=109957 RepID=A0AAD5T312_9FUNG|nr:hypothetical protein HK100_010408 [Physocladia obscura]